LVLGSFFACNGSTVTVPNPTGGNGTPPFGFAKDPGCLTAACTYAGAGFVVHEWGTNTFVVGTDGSTLQGLHHEEEDLPSFVYDRIKAGSLPNSSSVEAKMETPVTYFYSDKAMSVDVKVSFPEGALTQWYPAVKSFAPRIAGNGQTWVDPLVTPQCIAHGFGAVTNGLLDWGTIQVLPRDAKVSLPDAPLDSFSWSHARAVASNPLFVTGNPGIDAKGGQAEKFLFYRGLGNFPPPAKVTWDSEIAGPRVDAPASDSVSSVFVLNVGTTAAGFVKVSDAVQAGASASHAVPAQDTPMDAYTDALGVEIVKALDQTGLYHDEAMAMVNTWRSQWFRTPGIRVLYLASPAWIDQKIPLSIVPQPDTMKRAMVIRVELLTPAIEKSDAAQAMAFASDAPAAKAYFDALGRFAEPRLRRAIAIVGSTPPNADTYLASIAKMNTSAAPGE
jgi:hypothetical protein